MTGERQLLGFQEEQDRQHKNYKTISYVSKPVKKTQSKPSHQPHEGRRSLGVARVDL